MPELLIQCVYFFSAILFIFGLKKVTVPNTAKSGAFLVSLGLIVSVLISFFHKEVQGNFLLMTLAMLIGGVLAFFGSRNTTKQNASKMLVLFTGFGGGAATAIASIVLIKLVPQTDLSRTLTVLAIFLGSISFAGSSVLFVKQQGFIKSAIRLPMHHWLIALAAVIALTFAAAIVLNKQYFELSSLVLLVLFSGVLGKLFAFPVRKADSQTLVSFFTGLTGLSVALTGVIYTNVPMLIGGMLAAVISWVVVKRTGKVKTLNKILFTNGSDYQAAGVGITSVKSQMMSTTVNEAAMLMSYAKNVILVPGYGLAVAQAQGSLSDTARVLNEKGVNVKFALHPAAGRMPGHMNALLVDAGVSYDSIYDIADINQAFESTDVVLVVGGNDVVNPTIDGLDALSGLETLNVDQANKVIVVKRGDGLGYSGETNPLFYNENVQVLIGDAKTVLNELVSEITTI